MLVSLVYIHLDHIPNIQEQIEKNIVFHELQTTYLKNSVYTFTHTTTNYSFMNSVGLDNYICWSHLTRNQ